MPSLIAFGRKWNIASDDFVFPEISEALVRLSWIAVAFAVFILHFPLACTGKDMTMSLLTLLVVNGVTVALAILTVVISSRGSIMNPYPRRHVATLLYIRIPLFILELALTIVSTVNAFQPDPPGSVCHFSNMLKLTISLEWVLIACMLIGMLLVLNPVDDDDVEDSAIIARRTWSRRFRIFTIRRDASMRAAMDDIANLMSSFFADVDIVFSDVLAGLFLLAHSPTNVYPPLIPASSDRPEWMTVENALHFQHFASCVYGWPTYLLHNFGIRPAYRLYRKLQCCGRLRCDQKDNDGMSTRNTRKDSRVHVWSQYKVLVIEDNCCFCNTAAFTLSNEQRNIDLFFVSFRNQLYEVPFVVLADHDTHSIVIAIRGSCSLVDLVTDLCLDDEILSVDVDADPLLRADPSLDTEGEVRVHRGMLMSARYVFDTLRKHQVLEDLAVLNTGYQLVVCGHSLGAGVASLLTLLLKQDYPDVRCYAFAPPGCVISENGLHELEQHVMSIVAGDDVVSRISFHALQRLRIKLASELDACTKAKYEILIRGIFRIFFSPAWESGPLSGNDVLTDRLNLIPDGASINGGSYGAAIVGPTTAAAITVATNQLLATRVQLFAPGKLLYVAEDESQENGVACEWIDPKCLTDVKLTASAMTDHLPKSIERILEKVIAAKGSAVVVPAAADEGSSADASSVRTPTTSPRTTPPRVVVTDQPRTSSR